MARTGAEAHSAKMGRRASAATPMGSRERASHPTAEMVIEQPPLRGSRQVLLPTSVRSGAQTISPTVTTEALPGTCPPTENCESRDKESTLLTVVNRQGDSSPHSRRRRQTPTREMGKVSPDVGANLIGHVDQARRRPHARVM